MVKVTFLVDNKTEEPACNAEWGLSIYIEANGKKILMDQGASPMLLHNAEGLGIDLSEVVFATVSHGHERHRETEDPARRQGDGGRGGRDLRDLRPGNPGGQQ